MVKNGPCRTGADRLIDKKIEEEELLVERRLFRSAPFPENRELSSFFLIHTCTGQSLHGTNGCLPKTMRHFSPRCRAGFAIDPKTRSPRYGQNQWRLGRRRYADDKKCLFGLCSLLVSSGHLATSNRTFVTQS